MKIIPQKCNKTQGLATVVIRRYLIIKGLGTGVAY